MRGYTPPASGPITTIKTNHAPSNNYQPYHGHDAPPSPIRTGGLGGGGTGGGRLYASPATANAKNAHTMAFTASSASTSWGLGSSTYTSPASVSTGLPATTAPYSHNKTPSVTWNRSHRAQQASADFDDMVASIGLNRFAAMSPHSDHDHHSSSGAATTTPALGSRDIYLRMDSPPLDCDDHDLELDSDSEFARAFSPPRYAGYATLAEDDGPRSAVTNAGLDDHFTPIPAMRSRQRRSPSRSELDPRINEKALVSPPPHQRQHVAGPRTEESHESASSAMTGITDASAFRPQLSSSTSTIITQVTAVTSPTMGSDEMLMALMASQAAVDCDALPVGAWEEVESWKKELSLLSTRLDSLQARHQREVRILTAARTLQKLNQSNKRLSKQTMESLEQSEKRVEKAEKEVLVLRNREASLRRRLMEHWAGVMAWEVRRLERTHSETQSRLEMNVRAAESDREALIERLAAIDTGEHMPTKMLDNGELTAALARERDLQERVSELENRLQTERVAKAGLESDRELTTSRMKTLELERERRADRITELEEVVLELGRRERALEDGARGHDEKLVQLERERDNWHQEREELHRERNELHQERNDHAHERDAWEAERSHFGQQVGDRDAWTAEREILVSEREGLQKQVREHGARAVAWAAEKESLTAERDGLHQERASLEAQHARDREDFEEDREDWMREREQMEAERELLEAATHEQTGSRDTWAREREMLLAKHDRVAADLESLAVEHDRLKDESRDMQVKQAQSALIVAEHAALQDDHSKLKDEHTRALAESAEVANNARFTSERLGATLAGILGRSSGVAERDLVPALEQVRTLLQEREAELDNVHHRFTEQLDATTADRDMWRKKSEESGSTSRTAQTEMTELVRKIRTQSEQIADLQAQLAAGPSSSSSSGTGADPALEAKLQQLWKTLPSPNARAESGLLSPSVVSPNSHVNFAVLQRAYSGSGTGERYTNADEVFTRVFSLVEDARILIDRMQRVEVEKDRHKMNATRAAQLVSDSRASLEKYQEQVMLLEERLERADESRSSGDHSKARVPSLEREIDILQRELEQAHGENSRLLKDADNAEATINMFSARTLTMADDHEREKTSLQNRLQREIDTLHGHLQAANDSVEEERTRAQLQSAQMMGEMMDLQDEIAKLRAGRKK